MAEIVPIKTKAIRGFSAMSKELRTAIASKGGKAAHKKGVAHEWTSEEARVAGRKGGFASRGGRGKLEPTTTKMSEMRGRTRNRNRG